VLKQGLTFLALLALAVAAFWYSLAPIDPATGQIKSGGELVALGLDLKGGMRVSLEPDPDKGAKDISREVMSQVRDVLENRVNTFGLSGTEVRLKGDNEVLVVLPGAKNPEEALKTLATVAQMEFRYLNTVRAGRNLSGRYDMTVTPGDVKKGEADLYSFTDAETKKEVSQEEVLKDTQLILKGNQLKPVSKAGVDPTNGQPEVSFELTGDGAKVFGDFTREHQGEILAVVLDNKIISAPTINQPITGGQGVITGAKTVAEARVLANLLNSGALPIPLRASETQYVGATLGQESIERSIKAGLAGLGLVLVFMLGYYWLPGFLACLALLLYSALTFCIYKGFGVFKPIPLDLPGITGFILSVGMAVDANILIFERLKEELRAGKSLHAAIDAGFSRAFSSIFDSNVTTWIVCAILIWLGAPVIKGFAITLAIGVAVSMFTAITATRTLLHLVVNFPFARNESLYALNIGWLNLIFPAWKNGAVLKVYDKRRIYFGFSIILSVIALVFIALTPFGMGLRPGIDFTGGAVVEAAFRDNKVTNEQIQQVFKEAGITDAAVRIGYSERPWTKVRLEATEVDPATATALQRRLSQTPGLETFDPDAYKTSTKDKTFVAEALYTGEVTQAQVQRALDVKLNADDVALGLKGVKLQVTPDPHAGEAARVAVAEITTRAEPTKLQEVKPKLAGIGGGIIQPMYQQTTIGPTVANDLTLKAIFSVVVASAAIILYLAFRFAIGGFVNGLKFGICAVIALVHDVGIVIGVFSLMGFLAGWQIDSLFVTAALTVLGFSVHDTIVVYDRIREHMHHRKRGESFADLNDASITQTFDRSVNTSFTALLVIAALVFFGGETVRLFNIALFIGIAVGVYSSIFVASPLVVALQRWLDDRMPTPAAAPAGGSGSARPARPAGRRDDVALTPRSGSSSVRPTPATASGPRPGASTRTTAGSVPRPTITPEGAAPAAEEGTDPAARPGTTIRPRTKKRRM
jgi:protein-export membrane protein SecD/preprotein translocase SecF subunit